MLSNLAGNLAGMEYVNHNVIHENIGMMFRMGHLSREAAVAQLRIALNITIYERIVGRHLNTRPSDYYSIYNAINVSEILARSTNADGASAVSEYLRSGRSPLLVTHDTIPGIELYFDTQPGLYVLNLTRHPIDVALSWQRRGWGQRFGVDPLAVTACADFRGTPCPWWAIDWAENYRKASPIDRCILGVIAIMSAYDEKIAGLPPERQRKIHTVSFERLAISTEDELEKIAAFTGTAVPENIRISMAREQVPRTPNPNAWKEKLAQIRSNDPSNDAIKALLSVAKAYEDRFELENLYS